MTPDAISSQFQLSGKQLSVLATFKEFLAGRNAEYCEHEYAIVNCRKPIMVKGHAGTGKSYVMEACISHCLQNNSTVQIATPTGTLASIYKGMYGDTLTTDTVHANFNIPYSVDSKPSINWKIGFHDVIFIKEISQLSIHVYRHILITLNVIPVRPVLFLCGDFSQQQPLQTIAGKTTQAPTMQTEQDLMNECRKFELTSQFRVEDNYLLSFLNHIRHWQPSTAQSQRLHGTRVICKDNVTDTHIIAASTAHPNALFLTVSNAATNFINDTLIQAQQNGD